MRSAGRMARSSQSSSFIMSAHMVMPTTPITPNWSPSGGLPSYHDSDGSHAHKRSRDRTDHRWFRPVPHVRCQASPAFDGVEVWAAYHSRLRRPVLDPVVKYQREDRMGWQSLENRCRVSCEIMSQDSGMHCACDDFIIGLSQLATSRITRCSAVAATNMAEIVAWHA